MWLENVSVDARDPKALGAFWESALGGERLTWTDDLVEFRLAVRGGPTVDVCLPRVPDVAGAASRVHLDLAGGAEQSEVVERLVGLGATRLDIGQGDVPWVVLADVEGNPFCVMESREEYTGIGPVAAVPIDSTDPDRDAAFWSRLVGWEPCAGRAPSLRHGSGGGPLLEFFPEPRAKAGKNTVHLDARCEPDETLNEAVERAVGLGARRVDHPWGELPWAVLADPSGNEFCVPPPTP